MGMKPETRYYVLLGKVLAAIKNSATLKDSVIDVSGTAQSEKLRMRLTINGKTLLADFELDDAEKISEQKILDKLMGLYNVQL